MSLHENAIFQVLTHMLLLRTLSRSRSPKPLSRSLSVARAHTQAFTRTETQSHLSTQHATETQTHLPTQHRAPRQESARASERRQACDIDGLQCSRLKVATATKVVVAGERPDPGASSHHRIIASSARCRRTFGGCLPYAQRRYTKHSACLPPQQLCPCSRDPQHRHRRRRRGG